MSKREPYVLFIISRREVEELDTTRLVGLIETLQSEPIRNMGRVDLGFGGYDADSRELWDIPQVTKYLRKFTEQKPNWPWYFKMEEKPGRCPGFVLAFLSAFDNPRLISEEEEMNWIMEAQEWLGIEAFRAGASQRQFDKVFLGMVDAVSGVRGLRRL